MLSLKRAWEPALNHGRKSYRYFALILNHKTREWGQNKLSNLESFRRNQLNLKIDLDHQNNISEKLPKK
ncbi:hypothetical protein BpHYR1_026506 [Brachionus plicatilis]|uniref:Uncharacterized protein n=1 Tax=Brachionus plicatilis TaxID=10195 RepID=A0A3M7PA27_BRAPC|nr:hypothetical protein BpHYR1_026506 [Brachionus plicatilis]